MHINLETMTYFAMYGDYVIETGVYETVPKPYWGKPAVRLIGDRGDVGIIRSPVRAEPYELGTGQTAERGRAEKPQKGNGVDA